ncbi:MAG: cyclic pyranopterin monophosphate synthase [Methanohalophilus sp.]|nr:cyclic pyranopterin monophosphate synthase [Methanohalophilus sp.]
MKDFTHIKNGRAQMVDIAGKKRSYRRATASGKIYLSEDSLTRIQKGEVEKGNVLATARVAGIMAIKKTPELIPLCHPLPIDGIEMDFEVDKDGISVQATVKSIGKTGVEMEAITGVSCALLTIWDMVKAIEKDDTGNYPTTSIGDIKVLEKVKEELEDPKSL